MAVLDWFRPPRSVLTFYLAGAAIAMACFAWLAVLQISSDELAEAQRTQQRLDDTANRVAASVRQGLDDLRRVASSTPSELPQAAVVVRRTSDGMRVIRGSLPFMPEPPASTEAPPERLAAAEAAEFIEKDPVRSIALYRALAAGSHRGIAAKAMVGLGRTLRASGRHAEALAAYDRLSAFTDIVIEGRPADLLARVGRCRTLQDMARGPQLQQEAERIRADLVQGKWPIAGAAWQAIFDDVSHWAGSNRPTDQPLADRLVLADALVKFNDLPRDGGPALPAIIPADGNSSLVVTASDAGPLIVLVNANWLASLWSERASSSDVNVALVDRDGQAVLGVTSSHAGQGTSADSGLPWTVAVSDADPQRARAGIVTRRRALVAGLAVVGLLIAASGYFTFRGIRRELSTARMHAEFVSAASHELRTPLTSIRQLAHMLQDGRVESPERRDQYYSVLVRETERLHRLVDRLLKFGRVDAGQFRLETVDARELAEHVAEDFRKNAADRTFEVSTSETPCPLRADRELLTLAVWNLLENAVKYSPAGGPVRLDVRAASGRVRMAVTDAGIGIPLEDRQRIFQQFVRGTATGASGPAGSGLGLALVDRVVRAHGGDVELESEPGRGSVFTIVLPMETAA